jgi:hypothetical protein
VKLADRDFYADTRIAATGCAVAETDGTGFYTRTNESTVGHASIRECLLRRAGHAQFFAADRSPPLGQRAEREIAKDQ